MKPSKALRSWIEEWIDHGSPGDRLPRSPELARRWGVSESTVKRLLEELQRRGRVMRVRGRGTMIPPSRPASNDLSPATTSWESVAESIEHAIAAGDFRRGHSLPSVKHMSLHFHVTAATVIRACRRLQEKKLVEKIGKRYWVGRFSDISMPAHHGSVMFFYPRNQTIRALYADPAHGLNGAYRKMENELAVHGCTVEYAQIKDMRSCINRWAASGKIPRAVAIHSLEAPPDEPRLEALRSFARRHDISLLFIGTFRENIRPRGIRLFSPGNTGTQIVHRVVDYVLDTGIKSATFFLSPGSGSLGPERLYPELRMRAPAVRFSAVVKTSDPVDCREKWFRSARLRYFLNKYRPLDIEQYAQLFKFVKNCSPVFRQHTGSDLWLFQSDADAAAALQWAGRHRFRIPGDCAVLGFENNPAWYEYGISTCIRDTERIGYLLAHALLDDIPIATTSKGFIRTDAVLLHRRTTRVLRR